MKVMFQLQAEQQKETSHAKIWERAFPAIRRAGEEGGNRGKSLKIPSRKGKRVTLTLGRNMPFNLWHSGMANCG